MPLSMAPSRRLLGQVPRLIAAKTVADYGAPVLSDLDTVAGLGEYRPENRRNSLTGRGAGILYAPAIRMRVRVR